MTCHFISFYNADGACGQSAVAQFDLEASIRRNKLETCTSVSCLRVKREKIHRKCFSNGRCSISKIRIWKNSCGLSKTT